MGRITWSSLGSLWKAPSFLKGDARLRESPALPMAFSRLGGSVPRLEEAERNLVVNPCRTSQVYHQNLQLGPLCFRAQSLCRVLGYCHWNLSIKFILVINPSHFPGLIPGLPRAAQVKGSWKSALKSLFRQDLQGKNEREKWLALLEMLWKRSPSRNKNYSPTPAIPNSRTLSLPICQLSSNTEQISLTGTRDLGKGRNMAKPCETGDKPSSAPRNRGGKEDINANKPPGNAGERPGQLAHQHSHVGMTPQQWK